MAELLKTVKRKKTQINKLLTITLEKNIVVFHLRCNNRKK